MNLLGFMCNHISIILGLSIIENGVTSRHPKEFQIALKTRNQLKGNDHRCCLWVSERDDRSLARSIQANIPIKNLIMLVSRGNPNHKPYPSFITRGLLQTISKALTPRLLWNPNLAPSARGELRRGPPYNWPCEESTRCVKSLGNPQDMRWLHRCTGCTTKNEESKSEAPRQMRCLHSKTRPDHLISWTSHI